MSAQVLEGHMGTAVEIDLCTACHAFWFDHHESLKLSPASTLELFALIGERAAGPKPAIGAPLRCPRCRSRLVLTHDRQRDTPFQYWRCGNKHGRFTTFFNFLREKHFIKPLTGPPLDELRRHVQFVNCSNCGGPVDLVHGTSCEHCGSPLSVIDMAHTETVVTQLRQASATRPVDPALPLRLASARREVEAALGGDHDAAGWTTLASSGLVEAGVSAISRWLRSV